MFKFLKNRKIVNFSIGFFAVFSLFKELAANPARPEEYERVTAQTQAKVRQKIEPLLEKYCNKYCELVNISINLEDDLSSLEDLGFESTVERVPSLVTKNIAIDIQVDEKIGIENRNRLANILQIHLRSQALDVQVNWFETKIPRIQKSDVSINSDGGQNFEPSESLETEISRSSLQTKEKEAKSDPITEQRLRNHLNENIAQILNGIIVQYCPDQCLVERIEIVGGKISRDEAGELPGTNYIMDTKKGIFYKIDRIDIDVALDSNLDEKSRYQIMRIMQGKTRFVSPVYFNSSVVQFPETYSSRVKKENTDTEDPYGLEKLRQMLTIFRDLAGTKEIITNTMTKTDTKSESKTNDRELSKISSELNSSIKNDTNNSSSTNTLSNSNNSSTTKQDVSTVSTNSESKTSEATKEIGAASVSASEDELIMGLKPEIALAYAAGFIVLLALVIIAIIRFGKASKDANDMIALSKPRASANQSAGDYTAEIDANRDQQGNKSTTGQISWSLKINELKQQLIEIFMENPKVARETFSRYLKEDGVEATAKYLHIFGYMIIYELLNDPAHQRDLYELGEYYHSSSFKFTQEEEYQLLNRLKIRATASEIKVLAQKSSEKFDFLQKLDAGQIYTLIADENTQVQSIVLTQLDRKQRRTVFDMYQGENKVKLMEQLSQAEAIPKEYLYNVAKVLAKKVSSRSEFDTENLRSSDVLMDLLEKADIDEQKRLMATLQKNNPDTARALKLKLVTVEILPYMKDGHLLELVLGLEREDLLNFLAGTREHISKLLLRKAPDELAESWISDLENISGVEEQIYKLCEMKILGRIRGLANSGMINLLDINERIFQSGSSDFKDSSEDQLPSFNRAAMVA